MTTNGRIAVVLFGHPDHDAAQRLQDVHGGVGEHTGFDAIGLLDDGHLPVVLADRRPHVIFTFGHATAYPKLQLASLDIRRRWIHFDDVPTYEALADHALEAFVDLTTNDRFPDRPLVSVVTSAESLATPIRRSLLSLLAQTYTNWEWVIHDDSPATQDDTWRNLSWYAAQEPRIRLVRSHSPVRRRGEVKRRLCAMARGRVIVELGEGDELTEGCLQGVVDGFAAFPSAGLTYLDHAVVAADGAAVGLPDGWAFGFGSYREDTYRGTRFAVSNTPPVNAMTIRDLVGLPVCGRAWRREVYEQIGGYHPEIHVAEDFELLLRAFLHTDLLNVQRFGYIKHLPAGLDDVRGADGAEIARVVPLFAARYEGEIHKRLLELGADDFIHSDAGLDWTRPVPADNVHVNLTMA